MIRTRSEFFKYHDIGVVDYSEALEFQKAAIKRVEHSAHHELIMCEHPTVITAGRMTAPGNILVSEEYLREKNIKVFPISRGGDLTMHTPGQLVVYPIVNLNNFRRDLHFYMQNLENTVIDLLACFGIVAVSIPDNRGVWVGNCKIASIGIGVKRWISYHGIGLNVSPDLNLFRLIRSCNLDVQITSMQQALGVQLEMNEVKNKLIELFEKNFTCE